MMKNNLTYKATVKDLKTRDEKELSFSGITLLSVEEYKKNEDIIPCLDGWWWLRSPGYGSDSAAIVYSDGSVDAFGDIVYFDNDVVRPALILNRKSRNLFKAGDELEIVGKTWTVLHDELVLCNESIGEHCFREDYKAPDANDYEASDVKKLLDHWMDTSFEKTIEQECSKETVSVVAKKIVMQDIPISVDAITLLSIEEYEKNKDIIPILNDWWWLRSPGYGSYYAALTTHDGFVSTSGLHVDDRDSAVRPALILNRKSRNLFKVGDKFEIADKIWTVLHDGLVLCNESIGKHCFRKDLEAPDANDFEKSDVKVFLNDWARENNINIKKTRLAARTPKERREIILKESSGWGNGHDQYMFADIDVDALLKYLDDKLNLEDALFTDARFGTDGRSVSFDGAGDRFEYGHSSTNDLLEDISRAFPEARCYWADAWDYNCVWDCMKNGRLTKELPETNLDINYICLEEDELNEGNKYYEVDAEVRDSSADLVIYLGGGGCYEDDVIGMFENKEAFNEYMKEHPLEEIKSNEDVER